jgi:6-phosphogluconolactonase
VVSRKIESGGPDPDQTYAAALTPATGCVSGDGRKPSRPPSGSETTVRVWADPDSLARAVADLLVTRVAQVQADRGVASIVLTGGRIAGLVYEHVRDSPGLGAVDWRLVDVWWGDERFLPSGHPGRNETGARAALLDALPLDPTRVHPVPPAGAPGITSPESAAASYAATLAQAGYRAKTQLPHFDLALFSIGEDGHVASLFSDHPSISETGRVAGVHNSPKPPSERVTFTLPTINTATEIWILGSGPGKATSVARALSPDGSRLPAARVHGRQRTLWLLDRAAAANMPHYQAS